MKKIKKSSSLFSIIKNCKAIFSCSPFPYIHIPITLSSYNLKKLIRRIPKTIQLFSFSASQLQKLLALFVVACFFVSSVCRDAVAVVSMPESQVSQYKQIFSDFILPYSYGKITKAHFAGTDRVIVNIQDLHCHPQVQKNISNIIETFDNKYGITNVYLEGAYGDVSTKWLTANVNDNKKAEILNKILETGKLTGAEYYSAISDKTEIIKGLEKKEPYLDNLKRFGDLLEKQDEIQLILKGIEESTAKVKEQYYTRRQYKIEQLSKDYVEGKIKAEKYYVLLSKHIEKLGIDISKYKNTLYYITLLNIQKEFDYKKITNELQELLSVLKQRLSYSLYKNLLTETDNFKRADKLYAYILKISRDYNVDIVRAFPELNKYFGYIELSQQINPIELLKEEEKLTREINTRFSDTVAQREVVFLTHFEKYLKQYMSTKITSDDYEYYKENIETYKKLYNKYVDNKVLTLLKPYMEETDKFYEINMDRNEYFSENIFDGTETGKLTQIKEGKDEINKIINNMPDTKRVDIIVTGGFHSQTVTELLQKEGVSYIVITPNVQGGVKEAEQTYYEIAKQQKEINFQTLATASLSNCPEDIRIIALKNAGFDNNTIEYLFGKNLSEINEILDREKSLNRKDLNDAKNKSKTIKENIENAINIESDASINFDELRDTIRIIFDINVGHDNYTDVDVGAVVKGVVGIATSKEQGKNFLRFFDVFKDNKQTDQIKEITDIITRCFESGFALEDVNKFFEEAKVAGSEVEFDNDEENGKVKDFYYTDKDGNKIYLTCYINYINVPRRWNESYGYLGEIAEISSLTGGFQFVQPVRVTFYEYEYQKDENGKFKKDENGIPILKYKNGKPIFRLDKNGNRIKGQKVLKFIAMGYGDNERNPITFEMMKTAADENLAVGMDKTKTGELFVKHNDNYYVVVNNFMGDADFSDEYDSYFDKNSDGIMKDYRYTLLEKIFKFQQVLSEEFTNIIDESKKNNPFSNEEFKRIWHPYDDISYIDTHSEELQQDGKNFLKKSEDKDKIIKKLEEAGKKDKNKQNEFVGMVLFLNSDKDGENILESYSSEEMRKYAELIEINIENNKKINEEECFVQIGHNDANIGNYDKKTGKFIDLEHIGPTFRTKDIINMCADTRDPRNYSVQNIKEVIQMAQVVGYNFSEDEIYQIIEGIRYYLLTRIKYIKAEDRKQFFEDIQGLSRLYTEINESKQNKEQITDKQSSDKLEIIDSAKRADELNKTKGKTVTFQNNSTVEILERIENTFFGRAVVKLSTNKHFRYTTAGIIIGSILEANDILKIIINEDKYRNEFVNDHKNYNDAQIEYLDKTLLSSIISKTKQGFGLTAVATMIITIGVGLTVPFVSPLLVFVVPTIGFLSSLVVPHAQTNRSEINKYGEGTVVLQEGNIIETGENNSLQIEFDDLSVYDNNNEQLKKIKMSPEQEKNAENGYEKYKGILSNLNNNVNELNTINNKLRRELTLEEDEKQVYNDIEENIKQLIKSGRDVPANSIDEILNRENTRRFIENIKEDINAIVNNTNDIYNRDRIEAKKRLREKMLGIYQQNINKTSVRFLENMQVVKMISKKYGSFVWDNIKKDKESVYEYKSDTGEENDEYINIRDKLKVYRNIWIHICDAHSVLTNSMEMNFDIDGNLINDKNFDAQYEENDLAYSVNLEEMVKVLDKQINQIEQKISERNEENGEYKFYCTVVTDLLIYRAYIMATKKDGDIILDSYYLENNSKIFDKEGFIPLENIYLKTEQLTNTPLKFILDKLNIQGDRRNNIISRVEDRWMFWGTTFSLIGLIFAIFHLRKSDIKNREAYKRIRNIKTNMEETVKTVVGEENIPEGKVREKIKEGRKIYKENRDEIKQEHIRNNDENKQEEVVKTSTNSLKNVFNPIRIVNKINEYLLNRKINNDKLIITSEEVSSDVMQEGKKKGYKICKQVISPSRKVKGGAIIGSIKVGKDEHQVRLKLTDKEAIIYSNTVNLNNVDSIEQIEELTDKYIKDGVKNNKLGKNTVITFVNNKYGKLTIEDMENSIRNKEGTLYVTRGLSSIYSFDNDNENEKITESKCKGIATSYGITTFSVSKQQYEDNKDEIEYLKNNYTFIVEETDIDELIIEQNQTECIIDLSTKECTLTELENIKKEIVKKYGVNLTVYVKLSDETFSQLQLDGINISKKTGFKPLVEAKDVIKVIGEKGVYNIADEKQIEGQTDIVCLMFDKKSEETLLKKGVNAIRDIIDSVVNNVNSSQSKFETGKNRALSSQDYKLNSYTNETIKVLKDILTVDLETFDISDMNVKLNSLDMDLFNSAAQSYIQKQMDKGNYIETLGFILGVVENSVAEEVVKEFELGDGKNFIKEININENQAILMTIIGQMINGKNLEQIKQKENDYEEEVEMKYPNGVINLKDLVKIIKEEQNINLDKILRMGIDSKTAEDVKGIKAILTDRYGANTTINQTLNTSTLAIRSMLAAA